MTVVISKKFKRKILTFFMCVKAQDATQAYLQMRQTHDWLVKVRGAKFIIYFEDGARQR